MEMIKRDDTVHFKPEWMDEGDEDFTFMAAEDEDGGRVLIRTIGTGMAIEPTQVVRTDMLADKPVMHKVTAICMDCPNRGYPDPLVYTVEVDDKNDVDQIETKVREQRLLDVEDEDAANKLEIKLILEGDVEYVHDNRL